MSIKPAKLKIGLIGCGKVAIEHHLPSLKRLAGADLIAVADVQCGRLDCLTKNYPAVARYKSAGDLLADPRVDVVGVLTPTASHHAIALAALDAGKHVFLEKPLALSRQECDELVAAGRKSRLQTMVCFNLRWHRLILRAKEILSSGRLGSIVAIRSVYTHCRDGRTAPDWHRRICLGGGVTFNEGVHHFDLWRFLLQQEIEEVFAFHAPSATYEDETSVMSARLSAGTLATAVNTFRTGPSSEIEIFGSAGRLSICLYRFDGLRLYTSSEYPGSLSTRIKGLSRTMIDLAAAIPAMARGGGFGETFYRAWTHFIEAISSGQDPSCSFADGRQAVLASLAAIQSFQTGQPVVVVQNNR